MSSTGAGWRPDPSGSPGQLRWWDGRQWTAHVVQQVGSTATPAGMLPAPTATAAARGWIGRHPIAFGVLLLAGLFWAISAMAGIAGSDPENTADASSADSRDEPPSGGDADEAGAGADDRQAATTTRAAPEPDRRPTYLVVRVVDGDTVELGNGEVVRLVGIDAPETGECGHDRATEKLVRLIEGRRATLGESDEDRDRYGRLLRYVDRGPVDAGLAMIESGLAIARYDSRDGYGEHPREARYIRADRRSANVRCGPRLR
jgi:endonuclease YncB( thermonuclease family)